ncbi:type I-F CRISPR-associated protein Csy1 [Oceanospirillum maris]|uniref:type I-F CRISPR-associated protein Csy1 n=1 Tax=Oceanospirillum maris TaxID=64977 RepID=UPI0003FF3C7B|nr:type I-F CRISPR-associated protein Csy1 [Oceanospirillum maris]
MKEDATVDSWKAIISNFIGGKQSNELRSYLDKIFKDLRKNYGKLDFFNDDNIRFIFDARKNKPVDEKNTFDFVVEQLRSLNAFNDKPPGVDISSLLEGVFIKAQEFSDKYNENNWLTKSSVDAKNITFGTHVPKLTHSSIKTKPIVSNNNAIRAGFLTTSCLTSIKYDSVASNAYSQIRDFFSLEFDGKKLYEIFEDKDNIVLKRFSHNENQLKEWNVGFSKAIDIKALEIDPLLKQVYFPAYNEEHKYHLLAQIESSSLSVDIHNLTVKRIQEFESLMLGERYSFPKAAQVFVTSGNILSHGNVSQFNAIRRGTKNLFSCQPPVWHSQLKPPIYSRSFFYELSRNYEVKENIQYLADFLTRFENLQLSIKDPKRMRWIEEWIENLADEVLVYVKSIQVLPVGWSVTEDIKLKPEHQVLLDCYRQDEGFLVMKHSSDWQAVIIQDFSAWLNNRLTQANEKFTPQDTHTKLWMKIFKANFREEFDTKGLAPKEGIV